MRCQYIIPSTRQQCKRNAKVGSNFCWQHEEKNIIPNQKSIKNITNLKNLPADIFTNLGKFIELKDIPKLITEIGLPENIKLLKNCAVIENPTKQKLEKLHQIAPNLKDLFFVDFHQDESGMYDQKDNYFDIQPIANFKKLEALETRIPSQTIRYNTILASTNWELLSQLRYLSIHSFFESEDEILTIIQQLPKLEYLALKNNIYRLKKANSRKTISPNLKTLEFHSESDWNFDFTIFNKVRRIINSYPDAEFLIQLHKIPDLEVLEITGNYGFDKLYGFTALGFPKNIKYLRVSYDNRYINDSHNDGLLDIEFNNLEFLRFYGSGDLVDAEKFLLSLRKLKYLYIDYIDLLNDQVINILKTLKVKNPNLEFAYSHIYSNTINNINKVYNLDFIESLYTKFTPEQWLREHGYYILEHCAEYI